MQPYQEATEEIQRQGEAPFRLGKKAANLAIGAASAYYGSGLVNKVAPWLSKYIPEDLMKKGLSRVNPGFGKLIDKALSSGKSIDEIKDFIGQKMEEGESPKIAKQNKNIIEQYDPELNLYIKNYLKKGMSLIEAGNKALNHERFKKAVDKMTKHHKSSWHDILKSVYGEENKALQNQQDQSQEQVPQPMQQQVQQQQRGLNPNIQAALQKIMQM